MFRSFCGVALAGTGRSDKGEEARGGLFPSIWMMLKWEDLLVGVVGLELFGRAGKTSSLKVILAE